MRDRPHNRNGSSGDVAVASDGSLPACSASEAHLWLGEQVVDAAPVKADDDLIADDNRRRSAALVGPNQLLQRRGIFRDVALDEVDAFLRKILFRRMAGASAVGGEEFYRRFSHLNTSFLHCSPSLRAGCVMGAQASPADSLGRATLPHPPLLQVDLQSIRQLPG